MRGSASTDAARLAAIRLLWIDGAASDRSGLPVDDLAAVTLVTTLEELSQALDALEFDAAIVAASLEWASAAEVARRLKAAVADRPVIELLDTASEASTSSLSAADATLARTELRRLPFVVAASLGRIVQSGSQALAEREQSEARARFLVRLADVTRQIEKPEDIAEATMRLLREALGADRCVYGDVEADGEHFSFAAVACAPGVPTVSGRFSLAAAGEDALATLNAGRPFACEDLPAGGASSEAQPEYRRTDSRALIAAPLVKGGRLAAVAGVHMLSPRSWRAEEIELVALVAERFWEALERARVSRALRASEAEFRALFELSSVGVAQAEPSTGRYVRANRRFSEITGYPEAELCALTFSDLTHPDDRVNNAAVIGAVLRGEAERWDIEKRYVRADGTIVWVHISGTLLRDAVGAPWRLIANAVDVTDRKRAERELIASRRQLQVVTDSAPVMLASCGADYRFKFVNRAYAARYGCEPRDIVGRLFADITGDEAFEQLKPNADRALAGERSEFEAEITYRDLGKQWIRCAYAPERDDEARVVGWVAAILDITDRKRAEEALREADRRKNEFLAVLGHELRNPLAPLRAGVELLRRAERDPELLASLRAMMERQLGHLIRLVDDLLDLSRISRGEVELQLERVDLHAVIDAAVELCRPAIVERRHSLVLHHAPVPLPLDGDFQRLTQVVGNLLGNAAKYTEPGGTIHLYAEAKGGEAHVRVRDTGYGIPSERLEGVFEMFTQVPEHRAMTGGGGLGIGLALSRQLVGLHGGRVAAHSAGLGRGSEFVVHLPLARAPPLRALTAERRRSAGAPRHVLVVDDNVDAAETLRTLLELGGHAVVVAHSGEAAIAEVERFSPEVVLLDIGLPGMDGYEVARRIRHTASGRGLLLVALTGWAQEEDKRRASAAGFDQHLTKPVDIGVLESLIAAGPSRASG